MLEFALRIILPFIIWLAMWNYSVKENSVVLIVYIIMALVFMGKV